MKLYEGIFVFSPQTTAEERKTQEQALEGVIKKFEGRIVERVDWGRRPLGYPVRKFKDGYYLILVMEIPTLGMTDFRKAMELHSDVIKFMITVKNPKLSSLPSARPVQSEMAGAESHHHSRG